VVGSGCDALQPGAHHREAGEVETTLAGDAGVSVEGYVCNRVAIPDKEFSGLQVTLHHAQRIVAELAFGLQGEPAFFDDLDVVCDPELQGDYIRLVAVLLDVPLVFKETNPLVSSNPSNAPVISAMPSAYMATLRRIIL
jgi:hypothetical protein